MFEFTGGFIPLHQITDHVNLLDCYMEKYSFGNVIENSVLYCFTEDLTPLFTLRTSVKNLLKV